VRAEHPFPSSPGSGFSVPPSPRSFPESFSFPRRRCSHLTFRAVPTLKGSEKVHTFAFCLLLRLRTRRFSQSSTNFFPQLAVCCFLLPLHRAQVLFSSFRRLHRESYRKPSVICPFLSFLVLTEVERLKLEYIQTQTPLSPALPAIVNFGGFPMPPPEKGAYVSAPLFFRFVQPAPIPGPCAPFISLPRLPSWVGRVDVIS